VKLTTTPRDLEDLLLAGEIDALMMWPLRDNAKPAKQQQLRSLLPDPPAAERRYFERTGVFPIMHTVVMRNEALAKSPWAPRAIFDAYVAGKQKALKRTGAANFFPWKDGPWRTEPAFAGDSHPYGLSDINRKAAGMLAGYLWDQGFIKHKLEVDEVFAPGSGAWRG
jgi:4,5-dihydroxyphthalate decarboxylase